jgi:hypothetical protein
MSEPPQQSEATNPVTTPPAAGAVLTRFISVFSQLVTTVVLHGGTGLSPCRTLSIRNPRKGFDLGANSCVLLERGANQRINNTHAESNAMAKVS